MSIATRVEEIENHLVDDWNAVAGVGGDTSLDKNIENIARALDNVYDELPKVSGEGTSVTLNNTKKGRISSVLKGNTSQDTTNGKNLLNLKDTLNTTHNGISYTYNSDGSFSFSGTATTNASHVNADTNISLANGTYTFSIQSALTVNLKLQIYFTDNTSVTKTISAGSTSITFDISKEVSKFYVGLMNLTSGTSYSGTVYAMLESGSTATTFEPFTYGSTPNPNYPQPIHVVSGDNKINVCGKNVFNKYESFRYGNSNYRTLLNDSGQIVSTSNYYNTRSAGMKLNLKPNTNYTISGILVSANGTSPTNARIQLINGNTSFSNIAFEASLEKPYNFTSTFNTSDYNDIWISFNGSNSSASGSTETIFDNIQIEEGSVATSYEPYSGEKYDINLGTNLFDKNSATYDNSHYKNDNGVVTSSSSSGYLTNYIQVKPNTTYTIAGTISTNSNNKGRLYYYNNSQNWIERTTSVLDNTSYTFTTPNNCYYVQFQYDRNSYDANTISIQEGNSASYVPYGTTPIELCKIGDYQDKLIRSSGKNWIDETKLGQEENYNTYSNGIWTTNTTSGSARSIFYKVNGPSTSKDITKIIKVEPNTTYTLKFYNITFSDTYIIVYGYDNTGTKTESFVMNSTSLNSFLTFTTGSDTKYIDITKNNGPGTLTFSHIQLNKGSTTLPYEPYGYGKWYKYGMIGKAILDGNESWSYNSTYNYFRILNTGILKNSHPLSNYFLGSSLGTNTYIVGGNNNGLLWLRDDAEYFNANVTTLTTWLSTHNTIVYYVLATPTITEITNTYLINQLNDYYNALSYQNQTNISQENADLPFEITASALLDTNTYINQLEEQIEVLS